jgi:malate/lactate dehydrogenase
LPAKAVTVIVAGRYRQLKRERKETINNNAQIFIVGKNRQRNLRPSVGGN